MRRGVAGGLLKVQGESVKAREKTEDSFEKKWTQRGPKGEEKKGQRV